MINATLDEVKQYGRLYFRPLTPTQYHNEGYKPKHIRKSEVNANCPIPIFFCLDAEEILKMEGTYFVEKGLAGSHHERLKRGEMEFENLNFSKIYHNGPHDLGSDITQYRQSEIVRAGGIPITNVIRKIYCRSLAEKQTLLHLLQRQLPYKYKKYYGMIEYNPKLSMFFNNGIFIKTVNAKPDGLRIELNDVVLRAGKSQSNGEDLQVDININWIKAEEHKIIMLERLFCKLNYALHTSINVPLNEKKSNLILVEIKFDDILMYQDFISLTSTEVV